MPQVTHEQQFITKFAYARTLSSCSNKKTAADSQERRLGTSQRRPYWSPRCIEKDFTPAIACQIIALIESIVDTKTKAAGNTFAVDNSFVNKREMTLIPFA